MKPYRFSNDEFAALEELRVPLAVYQYLDRRVVVRVLSAGFRDLFGFATREEAYAVMSDDMYSTCHPEDAARVANAAYRFATEDVRFEVVYRIRARDGSGFRLIHAVGEHAFKPGGERLAYVWYTDEGDYSGENDPQAEALKASFRSALHVESLLRTSYVDELTGLPNMSYFLELVEDGRKALRKDGRVPALLFFDLSGMKHFNRKYGFAEGDRLLRELAKLLVRYFKSDNCSRFGQDHFAVLTTAEGLPELLERLLSDCASINEGNNLPVHVGVYEEGPEEPVAASIACDRAKYACDSLHGSYVSACARYSEEMLTEMEKRQYILDNLDRALAEKRIRVFYQPIIRSANGRVCDEEALARWDDPVAGFLSPADFIPVLEDAKLIYRLDLYMVDCVLEKMKAQQAEGLYLVPISVNLSRSDFDACDIVEEIRRRVDGAGIAREKFTVEITESIVGRDFEFMKTQIERFQALGFKVWMDDFGSGYSSLDVLQSIRFDQIKLDMLFMRRFSESEEARIILTELIRMALGLGIETVCEGVETAEQAAFLREVGCTKMQGYYYCRPIPLEKILERYREGVQIGFENPAETEYYAALGRINLYDAATIAQDDRDSLRGYFDTIPMAIIESSPEHFAITRCNSSYRAFMERAFGICVVGAPYSYAEIFERVTSGLDFLRALRQCGLDGIRVILDETMPNGSTLHALVRRAAVNPVTGVSALAVALLAVTEPGARGGTLSYSQIAGALSSDYFNIFCVDLDSEDYVQYSSDKLYQDLNAERRGRHFFRAAHRDALTLLCEEDQESFLRLFTKENVVRALDEQGAFTLTYRQLVEGVPTYVAMKAVRLENDPSRVIIGVNNVDAQMTQKLAMEQLEAERLAFSRLSALSGDCLCIYSVDPDTGRYTEYNATPEYEALGIAKSGAHFFRDARENGRKHFFPDDLNLFLDRFTEENVMREIRENGMFEIQLRLIIDGKALYVRVKAVLVREKSGPQIIFGVMNIDAHVRQELEYAEKLKAARLRANLDPLTGVKNRLAFKEAEARLDAELSVDRGAEFAIALFDLRGLGDFNHAHGQQAGDEYLRKACSVVCELFKHSPVFRVEGDVFAVIARRDDYTALDARLEALEQSNESAKADGGMVIARGAARHTGESTAEEVYDRAREALLRDKEAADANE